MKVAKNFWSDFKGEIFRKELTRQSDQEPMTSSLNPLFLCSFPRLLANAKLWSKLEIKILSQILCIWCHWIDFPESYKHSLLCFSIQVQKMMPNWG